MANRVAKNTYNVAVVGATGVVGSEMIRVLEERSFPVDRLVPLASAKSLGKTVSFRGGTIPVNVLGPDSFDDDVDLAFFSAAHSQEDIEEMLRAFKASVAGVMDTD